MKKYTAFFFCALLGFASALSQETMNCEDNQTIYYVSNSGDDVSGDGSLENPFLSVQNAIDLSCSGDTVLILPGFYPENITISAHNLTIGGMGLLTSDFNPEMTILDGMDNARAFFASGDTLHLADVTIQNGRAPFGAGLHLSGTHHSHVEHVIIRDNTGANGDITAHGLNVHWCNNILIENTVVTENYGNKHTVSLRGNGISLINCQIIDNVATGSHGGVEAHFDCHNLLIDNCLISGNTKGGLKFSGSNATITSTTISNNTSYGIQISGTEVRVFNCVIENELNNFVMLNSGPNDSYFTARNSIIVGGVDYPWVNSFMFIDVDETVLDGPAYLDEDGHLLPVSPAIGSGATQVEWADGAISNISALDLAGNNRPMPEGSLPDMGCYESELGSPLPISGCMTPEACNYDPFAVEDDGSCNLPGCLNEAACNYDPTTTCDGGLAACIMPGCTDEEACNYDANAACSGGECYYGEAGCDDPYACNYVSDAVCVDLMLCDYSCCPGPGCCDVGTVWSGGKCVISPNCRFDFDLSGDVNLQDLLLFLAHYETTCVVNP